MAEEAAVENLAISRFFCHKCNLEINRVQPDYTCPTCQSGFIEVLENQPEANDESDTDMDIVQPFDLLNDMLMGLSGGPMRRSHRGTRSRGEHRRGGRGRPAVPFENLIQDFIVNLTEVGLGGLGVTPRPNGPVDLNSLLNPLLVRLSPQTILHSLQVEFLNPHGLFLGNPGDYAWGREGLDAIVTQLLNQMDGNGPPPLAKEKIQEIPVSTITQDQVDSSLQCSVCWEDFKVSEPVRKLICEHVYHEPCIIPWLELHGTCPICRTTLSEEGHSSDANTSNIFGAQNGYTLASFLRANTGNTDSSRASSTSSSTTDASISSTNSFNSNNAEMDFD